MGISKEKREGRQKMVRKNEDMEMEMEMEMEEVEGEHQGRNTWQ